MQLGYACILYLQKVQFCIYHQFSQLLRKTRENKIPDKINRQP